MKKTHILIILFFISIINNAQSFQNTDLGLPNLSASVTALGDADNDDDLDIYISGLNTSSNLEGGLYIYDAGVYTLSTTSNLPMVTFGSARWGDIDNDNDLDILIQGYDDNTGSGLTDVYANNNDGTFTALSLGLPPSYLGEIALADINNDNFLDIAVTGIETDTWQNITKIYTSNQDNTFSELTALSLPGMNFGRIKFADYDNDGFQDFVLSGWSTVINDFYTAVYSNNQDGTFTKETGITLFQSWLGDTEWVDYNADGNVDLLISGTGGNGTERHTDMYKNNGDGTFTNINAGFTGVSHSSLEYADFDADGDIDIIVIGVTTASDFIYNLYNNDGNDVFSLSNAVLAGANYGDADAGDINNDGKMDVIITGADSNGIAATDSFINNTSTASLEDVLLSSIVIYPNPSINKIIHIDFKNSFEEHNLKIYTPDGKVVFEKEIKSKTIDLSSLTKDVYILQFTSDNNTITKKIILK